jgi:uncharacterized protein
MRELRCPTCRREARWEDNPDRPFCSERCRMIDLGNWASESYRLPDDSVESEDEDQVRGGNGGSNGSEHDS